MPGRVGGDGDSGAARTACFFLTGHRHYYLLFIVAACGLLLHFPRREAVMNAAFKGGIF